MQIKRLATTAAIAAVYLSASTSISLAQSGSKPASDATKAANTKLLKELPFADTQAFTDAKAGFIAPLPDNGVIKNAKGQPIYDLTSVVG